MTHIILLSGKQGAGKSTTAQAILKIAKASGHYSFVEILKFAGPLYTLHEYILNKMESMNGQKRLKKDGKLLQLLGTEWGRESFGVNVWVDIMKRKINSWPYSGRRLIIIDDCRFENEFDAFPEALRVRLWASEEIRKLRTESWRENTNHPSEIGLDHYEAQGKFDLVLSTEAREGSEGLVANEILNALDQFQFKKLTSDGKGLDKT